MNRTRCPWCGKIIDRQKDTVTWHDVFGPSVPRRLHQANCAHCRHKYGQVPLFPYVMWIGIAVLSLLVLAFVFQSGWLFVVAFTPCLLFALMPYSPLDDKGVPREGNPNRLCDIEIIEACRKIRRDELYFLDDGFDSFAPFTAVSPIHIYRVSPKDGTAAGEFLYVHEKNYAYIDKDRCALYDTHMHWVATIRFVTDAE